MPSAVVLATLAALLVLPRVYQDRMNALLAEISDVAEPATVLVVDAMRALAREMAAVRGYALTGDPRFVETYVLVLREERVSLDRLRPLAVRLGGPVEVAFREFEAATAAWHGRPTETEMLAGTLDPAEYVERLPAEQAMWEDLLEAGDRLSGAVLEASARLRNEVLALERQAFVVNVILVAMAIVAAFAAAWHGWRVQRLRSEAEAAHRELARMAENRARLIRGVAHDLKNPLGAVQGYAELLREGTLGGLNQGQRDAVERLVRGVGSALGLIQDLLDLSLAEAGELRLDREPVDLGVEVKELVGEFRPAAREAGLSISLDVADGLPRAYADPHRVRQIVRNLLSNAVKYTPEGGRVRVTVREDRGGRGAAAAVRLAVDVEDTGPGIPRDAHERIFEEFSRFEPGAVRGAGLGLAFSRKMARALGGDITVASAPGRGSTFTLRLPPYRGEAAERPAA